MRTWVLAVGLALVAAPAPAAVTVQTVDLGAIVSGRSAARASGVLPKGRFDLEIVFDVLRDPELLPSDPIARMMSWKLYFDSPIGTPKRVRMGDLTPLSVFYAGEKVAETGGRPRILHWDKENGFTAMGDSAEARFAISGIVRGDSLPWNFRAGASLAPIPPAALLLAVPLAGLGLALRAGRPARQSWRGRP